MFLCRSNHTHHWKVEKRDTVCLFWTARWFWWKQNLLEVISIILSSHTNRFHWLRPITLAWTCITHTRSTVTPLFTHLVCLSGSACSPTTSNTAPPALLIAHLQGPSDCHVASVQARMVWREPGRLLSNTLKQLVFASQTEEQQCQFESPELYWRRMSCLQVDFWLLNHVGNLMLIAYTLHNQSNN